MASVPASSAPVSPRPASPSPVSPIPEALQSLWREYTAAFQASSHVDFHVHQGNSNWSWFEHHYNGRTLKYTVEVFGNQPSDGYPLFIALHGGGETTLEKNDQAWHSMIDKFYRDPVEEHCQNTPGEGAVYVAARGITSVDENGKPKDWWNLHFQPESYVLLQRMIRGLFLPIPDEVTLLQLDAPFRTVPTLDRPFVNPNRVYLLGFSAGGDGAFQHAAHIPDVFSAVSAAGGHPNGVRFTNTINLPLCISSGEKDTKPELYEPFYRDWSGASNRAQEIVRTKFQLEHLRDVTRSQFPKALPDLFQSQLQDYFLYPHECFILQDKGHNSWAQPSLTTEPQKVLTNLSAWLNQQEHPYLKVQGATESVDTVVNLVKWVCSSPSPCSHFSPRLRLPLPSFVTWDLNVRPPFPGDEKLPKPTDTWTPRSITQYWLYLRPSGNSPKPWEKPVDKIRAAYDKTSNALWVSKATPHVGFLLNEDMVDFSQTVQLYVGTSAAKPLTVQPSDKLRTETLWLRGDPFWIFGVMVCFEVGEDKKMVPKVVDTLGLPSFPNTKCKL